MGLLKLSEKCQKCDRVLFCNEKRMEACAYLIPNNGAEMPAKMSYEPKLVDIRLDANTTVSVDLADIQKALTKSLSVNCQSFSR